MIYGQVMAGYNLGGADSRIRKILGKKKLSMIPEIRNEFVYGKKSIYEGVGKEKQVVGISDEDSDWCIGAIRNGFDEKIALDIFNVMEEFARYAFNKSHSVAYGFVGYKCCYLSHYFPKEWALGCLKNLSEKEKIAATLEQCRRRGIKVLAPSINKSNIGFSSNSENEIIYGLLAIDNIGNSVVEYILSVRNKVGKFKNFKHFYDEIHSKENVNEFSLKVNAKDIKSCPVNKKCEESLIFAGAFDELEPNRYKLHNEYMIMKKVKDHEYFNEDEYDKKAKFNLEVDYMGSFVSESPVDGLPHTTLKGLRNNTKVCTSGIVISSEIKKTKKQKAFLSATLLDKNGTEFKVNLFNKVYSKYKELFLKGSVLTFEGKYSSVYENISIDKAKKVFDLNDEEKEVVEIENTSLSMDFDFTKA